MHQLPHLDVNGNRDPIIKGHVNYRIIDEGDGRASLHASIGQAGAVHQRNISFDKSEGMMTISDLEDLRLELSDILAVRVLYIWRKGTNDRSPSVRKRSFGESEYRHEDIDVSVMRRSESQAPHFRGAEVGLDLSDGTYVPLMIDTCANSPLADLRRDRELFMKAAKLAKQISGFLDKPVKMGRPPQIAIGSVETEGLAPKSKAVSILLVALALAIVLVPAWLSWGGMFGPATWMAIAFCLFIAMFFTFMGISKKMSKKTYDLIIKQYRI